MLVSIPVEAEPPYDHDQPGGELASPVGGEGSQPSTALLAQVLDHEGIAVHDDVVVAGGTVRGNSITGNGAGTEGIVVDYERDANEFSAWANPAVIEGNTVSGAEFGLTVRHGRTVFAISSHRV